MAKHWKPEHERKTERIIAVFTPDELRRVERFRKDRKISLTRSHLVRTVLLHQVEIWERSEERRNARKTAAAV